MASGLGRVARQFGRYGMFAVVRVETTHGLNEIDIDFEPMAAAEAGPFCAAVEVGLRYAWEHLDRRTRPVGVSVRVTEVQVTVVDTTEITVVYAAALALWDSLKCEPKQPIELVPETRSLRFPV